MLHILKRVFISSVRIVHRRRPRLLSVDSSFLLSPSRAFDAAYSVG